jgi:hypothetical protein
MRNRATIVSCDAGIDLFMKYEDLYDIEYRDHYAKSLERLKTCRYRERVIEILNIRMND